MINAICDNALIQAFAESAGTVSANHVREACTVLDLIGPARSLTLPPAQPAEKASAAPPVPPPAIPSLNRQPERSVNQSFFARWAGKLGLAN